MKLFIPTFKNWSGKGCSLLLLVLLSLGCANSTNPDIQRGSDYMYKPGFPEVRFSAIGFLDETNKSRINIAADIVYGSLVFKKISGVEQAKLAIDIHVVNKNDTNTIINSKHYDISIKRKDEAIITSQQSYIYQQQIDVPPGTYKVYFTVTDSNSDKKITRVTDTSIPDPSNNQIDLTDIRMLGKDMDTDNPEWIPVTTYDVPGRVDSLMFIFQATNNSSDQPLSVNATLIRFESDTSIARPMYYSNYSSSSIEYKGIDFDSETNIRQSQRKLLKNGSVFIEYRFAQQDRGNYRFSVKSNKEDTDLFKARDFGVKSTDYPALKTAKELARPLVYLMGNKEYDKLMSINDSDSLKEAMDRFWLKKIGDKNKARNVIKMYYQRVEEANKQFSNFKEGWKTDPGMIYVLFGPPWYVEEHLDQMRWSYTYNVGGSEYNFYYQRYKLRSKYYPFDHFVLQRDQSYYNTEYQQRQLWLTGLILQRTI